MPTGTEGNLTAWVKMAAAQIYPKRGQYSSKDHPFDFSQPYIIANALVSWLSFIQKLDEEGKIGRGQV